jgi:hypothetical protein
VSKAKAGSAAARLSGSASSNKARLAKAKLTRKLIWSNNGLGENVMGALDFSDGSRHETDDYVRFYGEKHAESSQPVASVRAFGPRPAEWPLCVRPRSSN